MLQAAANISLQQSTKWEDLLTNATSHQLPSHRWKTDEGQVNDSSVESIADVYDDKTSWQVKNHSA